VTGVTIYAAGHLARRVSQQTQVLLGRIAGILLTAIAVTLLVNGGTRMVHGLVTSLRT
jgi:multiple antibiotic resistance protein